MEYEKPIIYPVDAGGNEIKPMACTLAAVVLYVVIAAAGVYIGVGYAFGGVWTIAGAAAVWYATLGAGCK